MNSESSIDFKLITEITDDVISQTNEKGYFQYISPSCSKVLGYSQDSLIGKNAFDYIHEDERKEVLKLFQKGIEKKQDNRIEYRFKHALGHYVWLETTGKVLLDKEKKVIGAIFNSRDITDRKIFEKKQRNFFNLSIDMMGIASFEGYFVTINNAWKKNLGWSTEELLKKPYLNFIHPDDREPTIKMADRLMNGEKVYSFKNRYLCKNGSYKWISWNYSPDTEQKQVYFVARDVTEQIDEKRDLEERVFKNERFLHSTIDNIRGVVYHCKNDEEWTMEYLSQGCYELTGYKPEELINNSKVSFGSIVLDKYRNPLISLTNSKFEHEYEIRTKNGETRWVLDRGKTIYSEDGKAIRQEGILTDITKRKQIEYKAHHQAQRSESLLRISSRLNTELELDKVKNIICEEACSALNMQMSAYLRYDSKTQRFHLKAYSGLLEEVAQALETLSWENVEILINKEGKVGIISDLSVVPEIPIIQTLLNHGFQSKAYSLVERDDTILGVLIIGDDKKAELSESHIELLSGLANHAASAITNARMVSAAKNRLDQVQALRNIDMAITGSLDLRVTFQVVLDEVTNMLQTDASAILRLDSYTGTLKYENWRGFRNKDIDRINIPLGKGYAGNVAKDRKSVYIEDLRKTERGTSHKTLLTDEGFIAYYAVPLIVKGSVIGVLEVLHRKLHESNDEWLSFLETLAGQAAIAIDNAELFSKLERSNVDLLQAYDETIKGWAQALDYKDEETADHSQRVTELTLRIAEKMGIQKEELAHVRRGALLHDIGKMGIPDKILLKPGKLNDEEWEIMRKHPVYAFNMISPISYLKESIDIPYCHHEKWDGSGYPRELKGEQIPLAARIFAVVDVFDALTSDRPYRKAWTKEKTLEHIREQSGSHFDPQVVDVFIKEVDGLV